MQLFRTFKSTVLAATLAGLLGSCQDQRSETVSPKQERNAPTSNNAAKTSAEYYLVKDGDVRLTYESQGRKKLIKQSSDIQGCYWEYKYDGNQILGAYRNANGSELENRSFKLNDQGLCIESIHNFKVWKYEYYPKGYLKKCYNADQPNERIEYNYYVGQKGYNLRYVKFYNLAGFMEKEIFIEHSLTPDLCPVNPDYLPNNAGKYLPIFGKFFVDHPEELTENVYYTNGWATFNNYVYSYTMGSNGLPKTITLTGKYNKKIKSQINRTFLSHPGGL